MLLVRLGSVQPRGHPQGAASLKGRFRKQSQVSPAQRSVLRLQELSRKCLVMFGQEVDGPHMSLSSSCNHSQITSPASPPAGFFSPLLAALTATPVHPPVSESPSQRRGGGTVKRSLGLLHTDPGLYVMPNSGAILLMQNTPKTHQ